MQDIIVLLLSAQTVSETARERASETERDALHCKSVAKGLREASPGDRLAIV